MKGLVTNIKRMAIHDGDGLRTTVFLKGCPLRCAWCHNPESISPEKQLRIIQDKCTACGLCLSVCSAHSIKNTKHFLNRQLCVGCGICEPLCPNGALILCGREMSAAEVVEIALEDRAFYENSGGGVTISGGEPLSQPEFTAEILRMLKEQGIHTAVDTSGFVSRSAMDAVIAYTDVFLYDMKSLDDRLHQQYTGRSNKIILENLCYLNAQNRPVEIRIPYIPGVNDHQIDQMGQFLEKLQCINRVKVLPYHNLAKSKYETLGMNNSFYARIPSKEEIHQAVHTLRKYGLNAVDGNE